MDVDALTLCITAAGMWLITAAVPSMNVPGRRGSHRTISAPIPPYSLYANYHRFVSSLFVKVVVLVNMHAHAHTIIIFLFSIFFRLLVAGRKSNC